MWEPRPELRTALTIAGSDSCGGAGIQADLKTFTVMGVYGMSVLTAITAQNTRGVTAAVELEGAMIRKQMEAVAGDMRIDACKTGMLGSAGVIELVEGELKRHAIRPYVCDPVMVAKSGDPLLRRDAVEAMRTRLFPLAAVVTPNLREAAHLLGVERIEPAPAAAREAARAIAQWGAPAVVKAVPVGDRMVDVFYDGREFHEFAGQAYGRERTHGSGCCFSAAITAGLARRMNLVAAIAEAKALVTKAIARCVEQGQGTRPVNVLAGTE